MWALSFIMQFPNIYINLTLIFNWLLKNLEILYLDFGKITNGKIFFSSTKDSYNLIKKIIMKISSNIFFGRYKVFFTKKSAINTFKQLSLS